MISVEEAQERIARAIAAAPPPATETLPLAAAAGRVLAVSLLARLTQPPQAVSAMDGWAVRAADCQETPVTLTVVGEISAGQMPNLPLGPRQCQRIFTGAPVPAEANAVVLQENSRRLSADAVAIHGKVSPDQHIRRPGIDFTQGDPVMTAPRLLNSRSLSLIAAANQPQVVVFRRPRVGILSTGSELVAVGQEPQSPAQIISSNGFGLAALVAASGGEPFDLGTVADDRAALDERLAFARTQNLSILVTIGGASVGDHDLVQAATRDLGMSLDFWKIAMRPGKPLIFGQFADQRLFLGLPGNPVSCSICGLMFLRPAIHQLLGLSLPPLRLPARVTRELRANDERREYLRATLQTSPSGEWLVTPAASQDSSLHSVLAAADCLIDRPPGAAAASAGSLVEVLLLPLGF
ncbi:MAG: molybdopterin molybdotransferase MoeA [Alphaproteobacteria bacterium]|nr:molybdopterin molybdotransferase MoeA [Alphaproteobacteria bacterium]